MAENSETTKLCHYIRQLSFAIIPRSVNVADAYTEKKDLSDESLKSMFSMRLMLPNINFVDVEEIVDQSKVSDSFPEQDHGPLFCVALLLVMDRCFCCLSACCR